MTHIRIKLVIAAAALTASVSYLLFAGVKSGWVYFLEVDAFIAQERYHSQRVRLSGLVAEEDVTVDSANLLARFPLLGQTQRLNVEYRGVVPDTFKSGVEVILEGRLDDHGIFQANVLLTKCASKYHEEDQVKDAPADFKHPAGSLPSNMEPRS